MPETTETHAERIARWEAEDAAWGERTTVTIEPIVPSGHSEYLHQENDRQNWNI